MIDPEKWGRIAVTRKNGAISQMPEKVKTKAATAKAAAKKKRSGGKADSARPAGTGKHSVGKPKKAVKKPTAARRSEKTRKRPTRVKPNPVAGEANRRNRHSKRRAVAEDLFMENRAPVPEASSGGNQPPGRRGLPLGLLNACMGMVIALLVAMGIRQHTAYGEFLKMRRVVDQQTFYEGTTVDGVDVSKMTLSNAMDYWRDRVEARNANRTAVLSNGMTVTAEELGYTSDYESVLSAAWSAGRNGTLEERYHMVSSRRHNPTAYHITRVDFSDIQVDRFVDLVAVKEDQPAVDAEVAGFDPQTLEFSFSDSQVGTTLDKASLKRDIEQAIRSGGGHVTLQVETLEPGVTSDEIRQQYGLIDYAITNASSSSKARLNNIKLAMSFINGTCVPSGETFSFNETVGQRTVDRGFRKATAYSGGEVTEQVGGGICQVSTTLFNAAVKADMEIVERHNHSLTVAYVDKGKDATVDWEHQDLRFTNTSDSDIYICCYLTDDKRVRFGIFGRLLPNGEKITLEGVTTEVITFKTEYQPSAFLAPGETAVIQNGRNGYKADAYKIRWDADGNQLSRELLCKSVYKVKDEIIQYGG